MVHVTVRNTGSSVRAFRNTDQQMISIKPGDSRGADLHAHTVMLLEREAGKPDPVVELLMSAEERADYDEQQTFIRNGNKKARDGRREIARARPTASKPMPVRVDKRFITDPKTVLDEPPDEPEEAMVDVPAPTPPGDRRRARSAAKRVALKKKGK